MAKIGESWVATPIPSFSWKLPQAYALNHMMAILSSYDQDFTYQIAVLAEFGGVENHAAHVDERMQQRPVLHRIRIILSYTYFI